MTVTIAGVGEIIDGFDGVLVDQFGVLHDGKTPMPGARHCLDEINARGVPMVALTNSGKRSTQNGARLDRLGFPPHLFRAILSSGELARREIEARLAAKQRGDGRLEDGATVLILARDGDRSLVEGLPLNPVTLDEPGAAAASLVIIAGAEPERVSRQRYRDALAPLAAQGVPALCANPDTVMYTVDGPAFATGIVAQDYGAEGGEVTMLGKPAGAMFEEAFALTGAQSRTRVLMIGDSPAHDIAGAAAAGLKTLLIRGGVQAGSDGVAADYAMDRLAW